MVAQLLSSLNAYRTLLKQSFCIQRIILPKLMVSIMKRLSIFLTSLLLSSQCLAVSGSEAMASAKSNNNDHTTSAFNQFDVNSATPPQSSSPGLFNTTTRPGRCNNCTYTNNRTVAMHVMVTPTGDRWEELRCWVGSTQVGRVYSGDFGGGSPLSFIVPPMNTYRCYVHNVRGHNYGIRTWVETY